MSDDLAPLLRGERLAVARALNDVEDQRPPAKARTRSLVERLTATRASNRAHRIGVTGPPGVGKSSLVAAMARALRASSSARTLGVLAVDPSSLRSGGALLGDRIRIASDPDDAGVFVRSLATHGDLGGLARAIPTAVIVLSAAFDVVVVETVGVGQSESDVEDVVDTLLFVVQPGAGDTLQHLKAGVMEAPDLFVVNKADQGDLARRTHSELRAAASSLAQAGVRGQPPVVVSTSALDGTGVTELWAALDAHRASLLAAGILPLRRRSSAVAVTARRVAQRYGELGIERLGGAGAVRVAVERAIDAGEAADSIVDSLNPFG